SVGPLFADVPTVTERLGNNLRQTSGKIEFTPGDLDDSATNVHKTITHAYQIFPNGVIITSPWYISVMILMPNAPGKTTVDYFMLTLNPADKDKGRELYTKSYEMVLNVFGNEDFKAAAECYAGLASGALKDVVYSGLESTIPMYYEILDSYLD
ncbi:MAG: SRPBCC family protein, partial [Parahaliea sp.]